MLAAQVLRSFKSTVAWSTGSGAVRADVRLGSVGPAAPVPTQAPKRAFGILSINQSQLRRMKMNTPQTHTVFKRGFLNNLFKSKAKKVVQLQDISPDNATEQAQYIKDLISDPPAVLNYFEERDFAVNEEALKLYIRAIVTVSPELFNAHTKLAHMLELTADGKTIRSPDVAVPRAILEDACENASVVADSTLGLFKGLHKKTLASMSANAGSTETAPIYVQVVKETKGWGRALVVFISGVFLAAVVFLFVPVLGMKPSGGMAGHFGLDMNFSSVEHPELTFADVKGYEEAKVDLQDLVLYLKNPEKFKRMNVTMPKGVLMVGPPGCGKTMLAKSLAGEAGVSFISVAGSQFEEMLVGVGASRVRKLFKTARSLAPCIIFIDEMDAVGEKREGPETRTKMTLNQLLIEMDGFKPNEGVIVIGATNIPKVLDPALTRSGRFDRMVTLELPDKRVRKEILQHYLKDKADPGVNVDEIAALTTGCSGADLYNLVNLASIEVVKQERNLITSDLLHDALDTIRMGRKKTSQLMEEAVRKTTAYHEAGHALVALHTPGAKPVVKATLIPRGYSLGATHMLPHEDALQTLEQLNAELAVCMGGTVAEELIFGPSKVTTGASNDIEKATHIAKLMVTQFGMSKNVGKVSVHFDRSSSPQLHSLVDEEVRHMTEAAYKNAMKTLTDHQDELHALANALLQKEVLARDEIMDLINNLKRRK